MTFLVHKDHGATNVSPAEVAEHEKNGWVVSTPEAWLELKYMPEVQNIPEAPKKRGRPAKVEPE